MVRNQVLCPLPGGKLEKGAACVVGMRDNMPLSGLEEAQHLRAPRDS
jgi:hypothetical protein